MLDKRRKRRTYLFFLDLSVSSTDPQLPDDDVDRHDSPARYPVPSKLCWTSRRRRRRVRRRRCWTKTEEEHTNLLFSFISFVSFVSLVRIDRRRHCRWWSCYPAPSKLCRWSRRRRRVRRRRCWIKRTRMYDPTFSFRSSRLSRLSVPTVVDIVGVKVIILFRPSCPEQAEEKEE